MKIVYKEDFNFISNRSTFDEIKKYILLGGNFAVELYEDKKIINLNIPHGGLFLKCNDNQWAEILKILK